MIGLNFTFSDFELEPTELQEIERNIHFLFSTPAGRCAGDRSFGIDQSFVDAPFPVAQNMLVVEVEEKIEKYEPRAEVDSVTFDADQDGQMAATFRLVPSGYAEEVEDQS